MVMEPTSRPYSSFLRMIAPKAFHPAQPQTDMLAEASAFVSFARATLKFQQRAVLEACPDKLTISQAALLTAAPLRLFFRRGPSYYNGFRSRGLYQSGYHGARFSG
jgi:hypothetical protein